MTKIPMEILDSTLTIPSECIKMILSDKKIKSIIKQTQKNVERKKQSKKGNDAAKEYSKQVDVPESDGSFDEMKKRSF